MLRDQRPFRQRWRSLSRAGRKRQLPDEQMLQRLWSDVEASIARRQQRLLNLPKPTYPSELPIAQRRDEIAKAITENQVVVVCGETGSGKTTQLPKICLELGRGVAGMIGHTQPRRIAARSVAMRIAAELGTPLGQVVGYKVRFTDKLSSNAYIKLMTDGILLAETQGDRLLTQYDTIIIDEAHERSLNIDFLLGYLKQLLPRRPDLKLIITSATIDPQRFSKHFDNAPIIEVSGRVYPVEVRYRPVVAEEADEEDPTVLQAILDAVDEAAATESSGDSSNDILVFLSGEREIRETAEALRKHHVPNSPHGVEILPLYARLSADEQQRVFEPHIARRIVLATNVAETSLTVPGIRFVIDPGFARISRFSPHARVQRLPVEPVSQASANQRAGRCGRVASGLCIRLYSEEDFRSRPAFTDPEILRANLANVILQMKVLRLGDIEQFPFVEPPRASAIREGYQTLLELGAVNERGELTPLGAQLAKLPVDPRIGRMILAARDEQCLDEVLIIAAALATQDPRLRPMDPSLQLQADAAHQQFAEEGSDFLGLLKLWSFYHEHARELSTNKLRKMCQQNFLSYVRLREWHDVHSQLQAMAKDMGLYPRQVPAAQAQATATARPESIHRALLAGLLGNVGFRDRGDSFEYTGLNGRKFFLFPGSTLFKKGPKWIMAAELVETTRLYARTVARVHPEWIERLASHLIKRTVSEPHWNRQSAHVEAYEKVTLQGLVLVPKRRVHFGAVNPHHAHEIFIQRALVEGEYRSNAPFFEHNRQMIEQVRRMEAKRRRRDVMVEAEALFAFYDRLLPRHVCNGPSFEKWRRKAEARNPRLLFMSRQDIMQVGSEAIAEHDYPDDITINSVRMALEYRLEPGSDEDGITMLVPIEALNLVHEDRVQWLVPGMLKEKIIALIKTLPKHLRRNLVPAPDYAEGCLKTIEFGRGRLLDVLAAELHKRAGVPIPPEAFAHDAIPDHLRFRFKVLDAEGKLLAAGRDLGAIKRELSSLAARQFAASFDTTFNRSHIVSWDFGDLPQRVRIERGGMTLFGYPAVIDDRHSVSLRLLDSPDAAARATHAGIRRLFVLQVQDELATHIDYLPNIDQMCLHFAPLGDGATLKRDLADLVADRVFLGDAPELRSANDFERRLRSGWNELWPTASQIAGLVGRILAAHHEIDLRLTATDNPFWREAIDDISQQLANLMPDGFLLSTPYAWLEQFPRYLQAIQTRLHRLANAGLQRDQAAMRQIQEFWMQYVERREQHAVHNIHDPALEQFRWMIEELRVSLFAQELGTIVPVSAKRLEKQWMKVRP